MTSPRATSSSSRLVSGALLTLTATVALSVAADLAISVAHGYRLRAETFALLVLDAGLLSLAVLPALAALVSLRWVPGVPDLWRNAPMACVGAAASAPLLLFAPVRAGVMGAGIAFAVLCVLGVVGLLEARSHRRPGRAAGVAAIAVSIGLLAWLAGGEPPGADALRETRPGPSERATKERPNLLVIVLDTLRADHIGAYGYGRSITPFLDRFAASATLFEHAFSSSSWTLPAHATLFTGLHARAHGADLIDGASDGVSLAELGRLEDVARVTPLSDEAITLAEIARQGGLETGAMCANTGYLYRGFGLDQGFDTYVDDPGARLEWRPIGLSIGDRLGLRANWRISHWIHSNERYYLLGSEINELALRWLEPRRERRFFLFLNYMDAHAPYLPLRSHRELFPDAWGPQNVDVQAVRSQERPLSAQERSALVDPYDAEIRYMDEELERLFARLESWELLDRTLVVFVSDHGEAFGEHHELGHGNGVYQPEVHVPLIVREPGQAEGRRVSRFVHLVDILPTVLARLGLPAPANLHGTSLYGESRPVPTVTYTGRYHDLVESHPERYDRTHYAVFEEPWKLIRRSDGDTELYDLRADPEEARDVSARHPDVVARLAGELGRFEARVGPRYQARAEAPTDAGTVERLRALGYAD